MIRNMFYFVRNKLNKNICNISKVHCEIKRTDNINCFAISAFSDCIKLILLGKINSKFFKQPNIILSFSFHQNEEKKTRQISDIDKNDNLKFCCSQTN